MPPFAITVARLVTEGWECVDDAGRRIVLPADAVDPTLRDLRVGQRLHAELDAAGTVLRATLPG